jgi:ATP-dependent Clp protease protease subunit
MHILKTFSPLLKEPSLLDDLPVVARINKFDEATAKAFSSVVSKAQNTGQPVLPIIIDSYGGQVYSLMSMISNIKHSRIPVATIIEGKAMSCGAILFSFGQEGMRYVDPDATIMIHEVSSMSWGKVEEIKVSADETDRLNKKIFQMMAENCGHHKDYFLDIVHEKGHADWFLDADECLKHGLANYSHIPELIVDTRVSFKFE